MKYRQTVGRTDSPPRGWIKAKLSDCLHMKSGDMITAKRIFEVEAYPVYGGNGLRGFTDSFNREGAHSLIGRQGALCGAVHFADGQFYASEHAIVAKALGKNDQRFLTYVLDALNLNEVSEASAQPGLSVEKLRSIEILCPKSPDEQQAIAAALSDADGVVAGLERVIAKKRLIKQGAMQDLLTARRRLPGFSGEWGHRLVADLERKGSIRLGRGRVISKIDIAAVPGQFPIYSSSAQNDGLFGAFGLFDFDEELITWSIDGGGYFFHRPKHRFSVTNVCGFLRILDGSLNYRFLVEALKMARAGMKFDYQDKAHPSVVRAAYTLPIPELEEQIAIAAIAADMEAEIITLESRLAKARAVKEGMMQNLLTGRVRLV